MTTVSLISSRHLRRGITVALLAIGAALAAAQPSLVRQAAIEAQLAPPRANLATLARDGRHLAYTVTAGGQTWIDIVAVDPPYGKRRIHLGDTRGARVLSLAWTSVNRVVFATEDWAIATASLTDENARIVLTPDTFTATLSGDLDQLNDDNPLSLDQHPRPPRLLGLAPDADDEVIVEGVVGQHLRNATASTARLNLVTGEWRIVDDLRITEPAMRTWPDALGQYRLLEDRTRLPLRWRGRGLDADGSLRGWQALARVIDEPTADAFAGDAKRLWADRALPLGFSRDGHLLYFATNVGQDTFGVRAWDFTRQALTDLRVDLPGIDLASPVRDFAPRIIGQHERAQRRDNAAVFYTDFTPEAPASPLVFDRASGELVGVRAPALPAGTRWIDDDLAGLQATLEADHPDRLVQIRDWNDARDRLLVNVATTASAGRTFVYRRGDAAWVEIIRRDVVERSDGHNPVETFTLATEGQAPLHGRVTLPRQPLGRTPPLICFLPDGPWRIADAGRSAPAQMLAEYGCIVLEIEYRGSAGRGREVLLGGRERPDLTAAADLDRAMTWLATKHPFERKRVALVGVGYGGWLALRAAQLQPGIFRSVAALDGFNDLDHLYAAPPPRERADGSVQGLELARNMIDYLDAIKIDLDRVNQTTDPLSQADPADGADGAPPTRFSSGRSGLSSFESEQMESAANQSPLRLRVLERMQRAEETTPESLAQRFAQWFFGPDADDDPRLSVRQHAADLQSAVLLCTTPDRQTRTRDDARALAAALSKAGNAPEVWELPPSPWSRGIAERPEVWLRVAEFLNETLIQFDVQVGTAEEVPEP